MYTWAYIMYICLWHTLREPAEAARRLEAMRAAGCVFRCAWWSMWGAGSGSHELWRVPGGCLRVPGRFLGIAVLRWFVEIPRGPWGSLGIP